MHIIVWIKKLYFMCMGFAELRQRGRKQDLKWKKVPPEIEQATLRFAAWRLRSQGQTTLKHSWHINKTNKWEYIFYNHIDTLVKKCRSCLTISSNAYLIIINLELVFQRDDFIQYVTFKFNFLSSVIYYVLFYIIRLPDQRIYVITYTASSYFSILFKFCRLISRIVCDASS